MSEYSNDSVSLLRCPLAYLVIDVQTPRRLQLLGQASRWQASPVQPSWQAHNPDFLSHNPRLEHSGRKCAVSLAIAISLHAGPNGHTPTRTKNEYIVVLGDSMRPYVQNNPPRKTLPSIHSEKTRYKFPVCCRDYGIGRTWPATKRQVSAARYSFLPFTQYD